MMMRSLFGTTARRFLATSLAAMLFTGCYTYRTVETAPPGAEVRARLTTEGAVRRSRGRDQAVMQLDGVLVRQTPDSIALNVLLMRDVSQFSNVEVRDTIVIRRDEVESLMVREMSTSRSIMFVGALGLASYAMLKGYQAVIGGAEGDEGPDPGNQATVVPLFSIRVLPHLLWLPSR